jgi:predicted transcriptional regulator
MLSKLRLEKMLMHSMFCFTCDYNDRLNVSQNMHKSGCSFSWAYRVLHHMEDIGLIKLVTNGRAVFVQFTDEGETLRKHMREIRDLIARAEKRLDVKPCLTV